MNEYVLLFVATEFVTLKNVDQGQRYHSSMFGWIEQARP